MKQKIFYFHKGTKIIVKPLPEKTKFEFKLNEREVFVIELPLTDTEISRSVVNNYIERLRMN